MSLLRSFRSLTEASRSSAVRGISSTKNLQDADKGVPYETLIKENETDQPQSVPSSADVVVIGGGSLGCSTLYHLAKLGIKNTVLLEAHQLTAGTTWHTVGLIWNIRGNDTETQILNTTREVLQNLKEETGVDPGWINNGTFYVALTKERLNAYKRQMTMGKVFGVESYILDKSEAKKMYPLMNVDDVYGVWYCPMDGILDPAGYCTALTRYATRNGAKLIEKCPVTNIKTISTLFDSTKVTAVETPFGTIKTECVVNATGCWANDINKLVGVRIPLVRLKHAYVVTERIEGIQNMPNIREHDVSTYLKVQGDALTIGGFEPNPVILDKVEQAAFSLYDIDWDVFSFIMNGSVNRIPVLERIGIKSTVCGPESFTADHKAIMGEDPNVMGFYHCYGFNSSGMMLGGGCGQQMARWIANGRPSLDMYRYDVRRFHTPLNSDVQWEKERTHEAFTKNGAVVYPHDEPLAGRGKRKSPLHDILERAGCVYQERHGWERPGWFHDQPAPVAEYDFYGAYDTPEQVDQRYKKKLRDDYSFDFPPHHDTIKKECMACRTNAALFDMSYVGKFLLSGPDAEKAADWLFTADIRKDAGRVVYTCMLNEQGGTEADLSVSVLDGGNDLPFGPTFKGRGFYLGVGGGVALQNWAHIKKELCRKAFNVSLTDHSEEMAMMSLQGPASRKILKFVSKDSFSNVDFPLSTSKVVTIAGHQALAIRTASSGEMGWAFHVPKASAIPIYETLMSTGKPYGLVNAGYRALENLSTEKGYRHWHSDLSINDTPLEADLGFACKLNTKIPFLGREVLETQKKEGLKKKRVTLTLDDPSVPLWGLEAIWKDEKIVGIVRATEYGFTLGRSIAHGYVSSPDGGILSKDFLETGKWKIESMGSDHAATVCLKPPFDPQDLRLKGKYSEVDPQLVFE